jgi:hypothetical protein
VARLLHQGPFCNLVGVDGQLCSGAIIARLSAVGRWRPARRENRVRPATGRSCDALIVDGLLHIRGRWHLAAARNSSFACFISSCFQVLITVGRTLNSDDNSASVFSPDSAAIATRTLNSALCCFLVRLHVSRLSGLVSPSLITTVQKPGAPAVFRQKSRSTVSWPIFSHKGASCASGALPLLADGCPG